MPQDQHFVPQFILRKHSDYVKPKRDEYDDKKAYEKAKKRRQRRTKVNTLTFENGFSSGRLIISSCDKTFCLSDMYDAEIETELSGLEDRVARIVEAIETDFLRPKSTTVIARAEKDALRKFIFIMAYRNRKFHQRFHGQEQDYDSNDRERLLAYMHKKGFETPKDVWLSNIRAFIHVNLDQDDDTWSRWLNEHAYPDDANWFWKNMTTSYLCFCTPGAAEEEFILTENAYGIFEGPSSHIGWADWHTFAPINPKLLIIMRNQCFGTIPSWPSAIRDILARTQLAAVQAITSVFEDPLAARSCLEDLPVGRPSPSYSTVSTLVGNSPSFKPSSKDLFTFKFFKLPSTFVQRIMSIFLEEAMQTEKIVYRSAAGLRKAIDSYLETDLAGLKMVMDPPPRDGPEVLYADHSGTISSKSTDIPPTLRRPYLEMLERIARQLGSDSHARFTTHTPVSFTIMPPLPDTFAAKYRLLGFDNLVGTWLLDVEQACLISQLRAFTDFSCLDRETEVMQSMQRACLDLISTLHPRRVWLHIRLWRLRIFSIEPGVMPSSDMRLANLVAEDTDGPEDVVFKCINLFRPDRISRVLIMWSDPRLYLTLYL